MIAPKEVALIFLLGCVIYVGVKATKILVEELKLKQIKKLVKKMKKGERMIEDIKDYLFTSIIVSKLIRDRADKDLSNAKTTEQKSIYYVAGIREDERIKVYEELLRKLGE